MPFTFQVMIRIDGLFILYSNFLNNSDFFWLFLTIFKKYHAIMNEYYGLSHPISQKLIRKNFRWKPFYYIVNDIFLKLLGTLNITIYNAFLRPYTSSLIEWDKIFSISFYITFESISDRYRKYDFPHIFWSLEEYKFLLCLYCSSFFSDGTKLFTKYITLFLYKYCHMSIELFWCIVCLPIMDNWHISGVNYRVII